MCLTGQRRTGKSSLARELGRQFEEERSEEWTHLFVDLTKCPTGSEFIARIADAMNQHSSHAQSVRYWLGRVFESIAKQTHRLKALKIMKLSIEIRDNLNEGNWKNKGHKLIERLNTNAKRTYLVLDEFPDLVIKIHATQGKDGVENLLAWLQKEVQAANMKGKLTIILSGSIGIEPILQRIGLTMSLSQFNPYRLKPWDKSTAKACLEALARYKDTQVEGGVFEYILEQLGICVPQHVQRCWVRLIANMKETDKTTISLEDAEYVFNEIILKTESNGMIIHYEQRLEETLGSELYHVAIKLLDKMCAEPHLMKVDAKPLCQKFNDQKDIDVHYLFNVLTHDGYLEDNDNEWYFPDSLVRKWWITRSELR